ncbi:hypothetical protein B0J17DRAFT_687477 [Rhizoctonia solani]|nr:hypothetical protein B0J17DRAFT_687477 [Rhizoctonia solani]
MLKWLLATSYLFVLTPALINHGARAKHNRRDSKASLPEDTIVFDPAGPSTVTRTARLRATLPIFELSYGRTSEYELGWALEEYMLVRGRPLAKMLYDAEPDLAMFDWMGYDQTRRVLSGTPPIIQPPPVPLDTPSYLDIYIYIGADQSYRLRTVLGIIIRSRNDTAIPTIDEQVPRPGGVILGMLIGASVLFVFLILGSLGWMVAMRRYFKQSHHPVTQPQTSAHNQTYHPNNRSLPSTSNHASSLTSTRRRVRTADHGTTSPPRTALQLSPGRTKDSTPPSARKRAATLLQTIHTRAIRGSPKIGFGTSSRKMSPSLDSSSTTARKAFSPRLGFGQFSPRLEDEDGPKKERDSLVVVIQESPGFMNSWSSALLLDPFHSPGRETHSVDDLGRNLKAGMTDLERPASPTPHKSLCVGGNKTMSVSELLRSRIVSDASADDSGVSSDRYDHAGNLGFLDNTLSAQIGSSTQVTPQPQATLNRAESYAARTNQLGMALLSPPTTMHRKSASGALGISFDSFFSPPTDRPLPEPRYGEVTSERVVRIGHSQETLTTAYVTASESGVSHTGDQNESESPKAGHEIPEEIGITGSPSTLHSQMAEMNNIASSLLTVGDLKATARMESSNQPCKVGNPNQSLSVEYGCADQSLRALNSFPAMLRGSLSCFPEDVSLNTPILPSIGTSRSELTHREASDIMLLPADDLTQGCLVLTRVGDDSGEQEESRDNTSGISFVVTQEASNLVARSEGDSIMSPDLSEHATEQTDSIISPSRMAICSGRQADRSSNGLKYASQLFLSPIN